MPRYGATIKATIVARDDASAQDAVKKTEKLLQSKALKTLLQVEGIVLDKITIDTKITREQ